MYSLGPRFHDTSSLHSKLIIDRTIRRDLIGTQSIKFNHNIRRRIFTTI
jgi:hypothetical protein